jgi:phage/plasmid-like protein (TIGR03299 family)
LKAAGLDWSVVKRKIAFDANGKWIDIKNEFALIRETDNQLLSIVGSVYKPIQNEEVADFFKKFVKAGQMKMETAGSLWNGRYIWCLARVNYDFKLGKKHDDEMRSYLLICQPHVIGKAMIIQFTPIRVVCWNTLNYALGTSLKGDTSAFRVMHSQKFDDNIKKQAEESLGLAKHQMDEFKEAVTLLTKKRVSEEQTEKYFCEVLKFDPKDAPEKREPLLLPKFRAALTYAPGQQMDSALGTWWGPVNAVTHVIDHEIGRDRSTALRTAWLGPKAVMKRRAVDLAIAGAKKAKAA